MGEENTQNMRPSQFRIVFLGVTDLANSAQARKRARQAVKRRERNMSARSAMRTAIKKVLKAAAAGEKENATKAYTEVVPVIDKMSGKGLIHKNTAARYKSRLNARVRAL
jgi:small subunit ribosomal protein S20